MSHEKALEAAKTAAARTAGYYFTLDATIEVAIDAYLSAIVPDEVAGVVTELREAGDHYGIPMERTCAKAADALTALAARTEKAERDAEEARRAIDVMVPIHVDGTHVFIDGTGDVELDHGGKMRARITTLEAELSSLRARLEKAGRGEPLAYLVHNMMPPKMPVQARGKFQEPDHFLYPATRENDAREMAKIMRGDLTPLYAKELG
jgi:hypothetical protein